MKTIVLAALMLSSALGFAKEEPGIYWVPVSPQHSRFSVFSIESVKVERNNGRVRLSYALPLELTGELNYIEFEGAEPAEGAPLQMTSPHGTIVCPSIDDLSMCETNYTGLQIDVPKRSELLQEISRSALELQIREHVAQSFCAGAVRRQFAALAASGGEPCGFLRVGSKRPY